MAPLRVALLGFGPSGRLFHAPLISATSGLRLAAVVSTRPDEVRRACPRARVLPDADALWQRASEFDLAVLATPSHTHLPLGLAALKAGLPLVVDKPMAATAEEGRTLIAAAARAGVLLTVFHNRRWDGDFLTLRRLLAEGALGRVLRFESRFERWRPQLKGGWREQPGPGELGGLLYDLGPHLVDQALVLFGRPRLVHAEMDMRRAGARAEDDVFLALEHPGGVRSHLWMSSTAAHLGPRLRVLGSQAAWVKRGLDVQEEQSRAGLRPTDPAWGREEPERWGTLGAGDRHARVPTEPGCWGRFYESLAAALRGEGPVPVDPEDAVAGLEVLEAVSPRASSPP